MEEQEIWKDIKGYEGLYQVSSFGRIKSCEKIVKHFRGGTRVLKERIRSLASDKNGYTVVDLYKDGIGKMYKVHRLVCEAFYDNPENKETVNHKNGIKNFNNKENLEWATPKENSQHSFSVLLRKINNAHFEKPVIVFDKKSSKFIDRFDSIKKASDFLHCQPQQISAMLMGRQKSVRGCYFKYETQSI